MKHEKTVKLCLAALMTALVFVATYIVQIPMPATDGFVNLGDCMVLLSAFLLGPAWGCAAGGIGSMLTDLIGGYTHFVPGTLVIKGLMALCTALLFRTLRNKTGFAPVISGLLGEVIMVLGYFAYEALFLGYGMGAVASIPGNAVQGAVGLILGVLVYKLLEKIPSIKKLSY